jgi:hypothetical protein
VLWRRLWWRIYLFEELDAGRVVVDDAAVVGGG